MLSTWDCSAVMLASRLSISQPFYDGTFSHANLSSFIHYCDVTWTHMRVNHTLIRRFVQQLVQNDNKENFNYPILCVLVSGIHRSRCAGDNFIYLSHKCNSAYALKLEREMTVMNRHNNLMCCNEIFLFCRRRRTSQYGVSYKSNDI